MKTSIRRAPYVDAVGSHLLDIPWARRQEILDDLERHLRESDLLGDDLHSWTKRFGPPSEYARQLRDDLGLATDRDGLARGRRWHLRTATRRTKVLLVAVVLTFVAAVGAVRWMSTLQPFHFGNVIAMPGSRHSTAGSHDEYQWTFRTGRGFAIGTQLFNDGPVAVRVTDLVPWPGGGPRPGLSVPWDNWRLTLGLAEDEMAPSGRPFRPFTLQPGDEEWIWIEGDFIHCPRLYEVGSSAGLSDVPVTFEVFGFERREVLDLGFTYSVTVGRECVGSSG